MPLRLDLVDYEIPLNSLKTSLFRGAGIVNDDSSLDLIKDCKWSVSILGDKIVVAEHNTAVILSINTAEATTRNTSSSSSSSAVKLVSQINIDEYEHHNLHETELFSEIGAVLCLPVQTHASTTTWWTCVIIATRSGSVHFFTDDGRHLAWQRMHTQAVVDLTINSFALCEPGAFTERDSISLLVHFADGIIVSIEGSHLLQCLEIYRRSKAKIFARALPQLGRYIPSLQAHSGGSGESEELFPLLQYTKLSVTRQAISGSSTSPSGANSESSVVPIQTSVRRRCSRLEQLQTASFLGGFDETARITLPTYYVYISPSTYSLLGSHELLAFSFVADDHIHISLSELASIAADKLKSSVKSTFKSASSTLFGLASAFRGGGEQQSHHQQENEQKPEELLLKKRLKPLATKTVVQDPRCAFDERTGSERQITRIACSPTGLLIACADNLARVLLINVLNGICVHIFKGYRDAQIAWIFPDENDDSTDDRDSDYDVATTRKRQRSTSFRHTRPCLLIYEAKRGLLELWRCDSQPVQRVYVQLVNKNARLLSTSAEILQTPFWSAAAASDAAANDLMILPSLSHSSKKQHHHQHQSRVKCYLLINNNTATLSSSPATSTSTTINTTVTLVALHVPAYFFMLTENTANSFNKIPLSPNPLTSTPSLKGSIPSFLSKHQQQQRAAARDLALVQAFKQILSDNYSSSCTSPRRRTSSTAAKTSVASEELVRDLSANFTAIESSTSKLECVMYFVQSNNSSVISPQVADKILQELLTTSSTTTGGRLGLILSSCTTLIDLYNVAVSKGTSDPGNAIDLAEHAELREILALSSDEFQLFMRQCQDIVTERTRQRQPVSSSAVTAAGIDKLTSLSWHEFISQAFDFSLFVKAVTSAGAPPADAADVPQKRQALAIRNPQESHRLAALLFKPVFDNNSTPTAFPDKLLMLCDLSPPSSFTLDRFELLQSFVFYVCNAEESPLYNNNNDNNNFASSLHAACKFARLLFDEKCMNDSQQQQKMTSLIQRIEHDVNGMTFAVLPLLLTFRACVVVASSPNNNGSQEEFSLKSQQSNSKHDKLPLMTPNSNKRKLLDESLIMDEKFSTDAEKTAAATVNERNNISLQNMLTIACYQFTDLLAFEHLTCLTRSMLLFLTTTTPNNNDADRQLRMRKAVPKKLTAAEVVKKSGLTEYVAKWIVWATMPSVLQARDVFATFNTDADADDNTDENYDTRTQKADSAVGGAWFGGDINAGGRHTQQHAAIVSHQRDNDDDELKRLKTLAYERLSQLHEHLNLSLACEDVMANCTWEAARAWHEQPHQLMWLQQSISLVRYVRHNTLVRHGLCSMIWHVVGVAQRLQALMQLCDRCGGRAPKDRVVREASDVGFLTQHDTEEFLCAAENLLLLCLQTVVTLNEQQQHKSSSTTDADDNVQLMALPELEWHWLPSSSSSINSDADDSKIDAATAELSKRPPPRDRSAPRQQQRRGTAALFDVAIEQKRMNVDILHLHALQVKLLQSLSTLQLRQANLLELFSAQEAELLSQKLDAVVASSSSNTKEDDEEDERSLLRIRRLQFLKKLFHASVVVDYRRQKASSGQQQQQQQPVDSTSSYWYKLVGNLFAHHWHLNDNLDANVRAPYIYELFSAGFDTIGQEIFQTCSDAGDCAAPKVLDVIGCRIAHLLDAKQKNGLFNRLSQATRTWLGEHDEASSQLIEPNCTLLKCRDLLRMVLAIQRSSNNSTSSSSGGTIPASVRAVAVELERELSNALE